MPDTCQNWVYFYAVNVVMVDMETVIVVSFIPIIVVNSFIRNWSHKNKTVSCWTRLTLKNEFPLVALCNGWVILDIDVM